MTRHAAKKARIFLVDDNQLVLRGLRMLLESEAGFVVCGEAVDGPAAIRGVAQTKPDLVMVDLSLKKGDGFELVARFRADYPHLRILVFTMHEKVVFAERAMAAGADGYLLKHEATDKVVDVVKMILRGKKYVSAKVDRDVLEREPGWEWTSENGEELRRPRIRP